MQKLMNTQKQLNALKKENQDHFWATGENLKEYDRLHDEVENIKKEARNMKKYINFTELKENYKLEQGLEEAMLEAKKQGFNVYVCYIGEFDNRVSYFETEYKGLWGYVEVAYFGGYNLSMPIKPSKKHGGYLALSGLDRKVDVGISFEDFAEKLPLLKNSTNYNKLIGEHKNYNDTRFEKHKTLVEWNDCIMKLKI